MGAHVVFARVAPSTVGTSSLVTVGARQARHGGSGGLARPRRVGALVAYGDGSVLNCVPASR